MKLSGSNLLSCLCAVIITGCGGTGIQAPPTVTQSADVRPDRSGSWMAPEAKGEDLLYVSSSTHGVEVFSYPQGKEVGSLSGPEIPLGLCTDADGNVFVVDNGSQEILEYAHGGTSPIATLSDYGNAPNGCAVDPKTGNLAVAGGGLHVQGTVAIYQDAKGTPTLYYDRYDQGPYQWCAYDDRSNLFVNEGAGGEVGLLEFSNGNWTVINVDKSLNGGGAVQWTGKYLAIGSPKGNGHGTKGPFYVYQLAISGSSASVVRTTTLYTGKRNRNPGYGIQFWIQAGRLVSPKTDEANIGIWGYPKGGEPLKSIGYAAGPFEGITVSASPTN